MLQYLHLMWVALCFPVLMFAQTATVTGIITDEQTGETLVGASVQNGQNSIGAITDIEGRYTLTLPAGKHNLRYSYVGYKELIRPITLAENATVVINITLGERKTDLDAVVVSASQYQKRLAEETVSIDVIKNYVIENTNVRDLAEAVSKVPGVNVVDGQATIRGGSGYAYGTGTRVQVLVDDMPLVTGDFGEVRWDFIPMENAEQVEVLKGAASVVYGSSALNGVINVRTGFAKSKPETRFTLFQGLYFNPRNSKAKWWSGREQPNFTGLFFSHREKKGQWDFVTGIGANILESYQREGDTKQMRINFKSRYRHPKLEGLNMGINANAMLQKFGRVFMWQNADSAAYLAFGGENYDRYSLINIDPYVNYLTDNGLTHRLKTRFYRVERYNVRMEPTTTSNTIFAEYQVQKNYDFGLVVTGGLVGNFFRGFSSLYQNKDLFINTYGMAAYLQAEQKINRLSIVGGARYENNTVDILLDTLQVNIPIVFRLGMNYEVNKNTYLRASFGQGYRSPNLVERFIDADLEGTINIFANPQLLPEQGWNAEIGLKQGVKIGDWQGTVDAVLFWTEYQNMTEFLLTNLNGKIGFQTQNTGNTRIAGWELSTSGDGKIAGLPLRLWGGYTFNYPGDLESDTLQRRIGPYLSNLFQSLGGVDSLQNSILRYRFRNTARIDAETDIKRFTIGYTCSYNSFMDRIDDVFNVFIQGLEEFRQRNNRGIWVSDARLAYRIDDQSSVALIGKNIFNLEYALRPGLMDAPANITLQYKLKL
ncbi:MAG TPA: TonB-dependent receptor [Chitinophagales bacterium]|nr:TonB-dependent receptor [Chitinophagales bacterium]